MPRKAPKRITKADAEKVLELVREGYPVSVAARHLGFDRTAFTHKANPRAYQQRHPDFAQKLADAQAIAAEEWEHKLTVRAWEGVEEPVISQGRLVRNDDGTPLTMRKIFATDAYFLLKAALPHKYRDNARVEHTGAGGGPVEITFGFVPDAALPEQQREK